MEMTDNRAVQYGAVQGGEVNRDWTVSLFGIGDLGTCVFSFFCCPCAQASARSRFDGSNWCVNCLCMTPSASRWAIRTGYGIPGSAHWDCWMGALCACCVINQELQTVNSFGRVPVQNAGPEHLINERKGYGSHTCCEICYAGWYSLLCSPCAMGLAMESAGMPCWFGACCVGSFAGNSLQRYHHRIRPMFGNEIWGDGLIPCFCILISDFTFGAAAPLAGWWFTFTSLLESNVQMERKGICYGCDLFGCIAGSCGYLFSGCKCDDKEGRYLISSVPRN
eukprot:gene36052-43722_t